MARPEVSRVILIVMDSLGVGALPDAAAYGSAGSNTVANIARVVPLTIPTLRRLGLGMVTDIAGDTVAPVGAYGRMAEASAGMDSVTGHWEIAGVVLNRAFTTFPRGFPADVIDAFEVAIGRGTLGNVVASGTAIVDALGPRHMQTGEPIVYTSADSVFQIAAHEDVIPLETLYEYCRAAFRIVTGDVGVARVIARPFIGVPGHFTRTSNRRDFAVPPPEPTLLDRLHEAGHAVVAIGKIDDLFAGRGVTRAEHTTSDAHGMDLLDRELATTSSGLIATNLVDFDTKFGHRNDVAGYAANLELIDARLAHVIDAMSETDVLIVTADHGNDPTTASTDHSREYVPLLVAGHGVRGGTDLGTRATFADAGQTVAEIFGVPSLRHGASFLRVLLR